MNFVSEKSRKMHEEYLRELRLRMSLFEISYPSIAGMGCCKTLRARIPASERECAARLRAEIFAHEMYFESFGASGVASACVRRSWGSEANFLYRIMCDAEDARGGFVAVYLDKANEVKFNICEDILEQYLKFEPVLIVDICEHAYFLDYGFDRKCYLKNSLARLDLSKIEKHIAKRWKS